MGANVPAVLVPPLLAAAAGFGFSGWATAVCENAAPGRSRIKAGMAQCSDARNRSTDICPAYSKLSVIRYDEGRHFMQPGIQGVLLFLTVLLLQIEFLA